jgi:hypothetical protein
VNNARAVIEAMFGKDVTFIRTPKYNAGKGRNRQSRLRRYTGNRNLWSLCEVILGIYFTLITGIAFYHGNIVAGIFLSLFMIGFFWVGLASLVRGKTLKQAVARTLHSQAEA